MHKLDRSPAPTPACLGRFRPGVNKWGDLTPDDRVKVWQALDAMQQRLCAYCEGNLDSLGQHIEHFRNRDRHPQRTFDWTNLLGSCDHKASCGHFKDSGAGPYDVNDLIDPTVDDPDHFFRFGEDGTIALRSHLSDAERRRASETIRVLGLDPQFGRLRAMRRQAALTYQGLEPDIRAALLSFPPAERREYVREELARTAGDPFCTVIRHFLEGLD